MTSATADAAFLMTSSHSIVRLARGKDSNVLSSQACLHAPGETRTGTLSRPLSPGHRGPGGFTPGAGLAAHHAEVPRGKCVTPSQGRRPCTRRPVANAHSPANRPTPRRDQEAAADLSPRGNPVTTGEVARTMIASSCPSVSPRGELRYSGCG